MFSSLVAVCALLGTTPPNSEPGYLHRIQPGKGKAVELRGERYQPQPGDILLFDSHSQFMSRIYRTVGTDGPYHAGIVFKRSDGSTGALEAGTDGVWKVFIFDLDSRLHNFDGTLLIRTLRKPITVEQSKQLTEFCHAQEGKAYALGRLAMQATPLRPRNKPFAQYFGRTVIDRDRWICSELAVAAAAVAGVWDVDTFPANIMYPRDLCYDERFDLSPYYDEPALWYPHADLRRVGGGVRVGRE